MAALFPSKETPVNGSEPAAAAGYRRTSDRTAFSRVITTACFVMRIPLPALVEDEVYASEQKYVMVSTQEF